jgi:hypothetical protein
MATNNKPKALKAIFFDAAGTLFYLTETVAQHYGLDGNEVGLSLDAQKLDRAFLSACQQPDGCEHDHYAE